MLELFADSFMDFRRAWRKYVAFSLVYLMVASYVFVPILSYLFSRILLLTGSGVLLNKEVFQIFLNPRSATGLFIIAVLAVIFIFLEIGTLIIIAHKKYFRHPIYITEALLTASRRLHRLIGFGTGVLVLLLLVMLPFIDLPVGPLISERIQIPEFFMDNIMSTTVTRWAYWGLLISFVYFFLRCAFVFHIIILENKSGWKSIKASASMTRMIQFSLLLAILLLNVVLLSLGVGFFALLSNIPQLAVTRANHVINQFMLTFSGYLTLLYALMMLPINIIFLNRLYYRAKSIEGVEVEDRLITTNVQWLEKVEGIIDRLFRRRRTILLLIISVTVAATFYGGFALNENLLYRGRKVYVAAHRADTVNAPENSLSAIQSALTLGADVIEIDVQMTSDGVVVVHHDLSLSRMTGVNRRISELTFEELQQYEIGRGFYDNIEGERIPSLQQALALIDGQAGVLLDVKAYGSASELAEKIVTAVEEANMVEVALVQSFDYGFLEVVRGLNPNIQLGQIMYYALGNLDRLDVDFYTIQKGMLNRELVRKARQANRGIWVWTVSNEEEMKEVLQYDIDGIITSHVTMAKEIIGIDRVIIPELEHEEIDAREK